MEIQYLLRLEWDISVSHVLCEANQGADLVAKNGSHEDNMP